MQIKSLPSILFIITILWSLPLYADCAAPVGVLGELEYNTGTNQYDYCNDTTWSTFSTTNIGACANTAEMQYNSTNSKYRFCNGTNTLEIGCLLADITSDLIAHWTLDETSGTTAADDISANNGTMYGGLDAGNDYLDGKIDYGLNFDGVNDLIEAGSATAVDGPTTVSLWIKPSDVTTAGVPFYSYSGAGAGDHITIYLDGSGRIHASIQNVFGAPNKRSSIALANDIWYHIVVVKSAANVEAIYIDGVDVTEADGNYAFAGDAVTLIGVRSGPNNYFEGIIDDVRVYDVELSSDRVNGLYNLGKYCPNPVTFDGTDYLLQGGGGFAGISDSKLVSGSLWVRSTATSGSDRAIWGITGIDFGFLMEGGTQNLKIVGRAPNTTSILAMTSTSAINDGSWHHILFSVDMANSSNRHLYIDGADALAGTPTTHLDSVIDFTENTSIGFGAVRYDGDLADIWFDFGNYIDFSVLANRQLFYDNGPVKLGATGSLPTGSDPDLFLSGDTVSWHTNKGTGGGMVENGTITDGIIKVCGNTCQTSSSCAQEGAMDVIGGKLAYCDGTNYITIAE